jgi:hypothetical protein
LPETVEKVMPQLPTVLAATPGALESQAGQSILNVLSQAAVGEVDGAAKPSTSSIIGDVLGARLEAAVGPEPETEPDGRKK